MRIRSQAGNPTRHGIDKGLTGKPAFQKRVSVAVEAKGRQALGGRSKSLLKTDKAGLTQGAVGLQHRPAPESRSEPETLKQPAFCLNTPQGRGKPRATW